jgi:prepilin-type N-terminal cleavage/methylation domain-containing protein
MTGKKKINETGFTLIEIIVTVVIVAILGAMIITFLSDSFIKSSNSVKSMRASSNLDMVMANITQYYNRYPKWRSETVYAAGNFIVPTIRNGHYYGCTVAGTSNLNEPTLWPINPGGIITETANIIRWTESGLLPDLNAVRTSIGAENSNQNNAYGTYHVERNRCVSFPSPSYSEQDDVACGNKILKVTIKSDQGGTLTALFLFS